MTEANRQQDAEKDRRRHAVAQKIRLIIMSLQNRHQYGAFMHRRPSDGIDVLDQELIIFFPAMAAA